MTTELRIAEVASQAGISTATVRYYERIGVLPEPERAANGYRRYDDRTVARLEFVRRAKQLGCTLEEIAELVVAWEGGECGPIQDRLRTLVAEKLTAAQAEGVELVTLAAELRQAAAALERHRPSGACDDRCGCFNDPDDLPPTIGVALIDRPPEDAPIACTLEPHRVSRRLDDWKRFVDRDDVDREAIPGGMRLTFAEHVDVAGLARLAAEEQDCCRFFTFGLTIGQGGVTLDVVAPDNARHLVQAAFG